MKYMGSKAKVARYIVPIIQEQIERSGYETYLDQDYRRKQERLSKLSRNCCKQIATTAATAAASVAATVAQTAVAQATAEVKAAKATETATE